MSQPSQVESIFFSALEKTTREGRAAFLESACDGDALLRCEVERLLEAHGNVGDFLENPVTDQLNAVAEGLVPTQLLDSTANEGLSDDGGLDFLQPSSKPDSLGRLGHYEVFEVLGRGGFGIVFRAFDETLQRAVAIKVLSPLLAATSPARKRFLREARSSAKVRHVNIVQVYAVHEQPLPYLVMEFIPGETLQQLMNRIGPLETAETVEIGVQIARGLAAAHAQGLIHRDIKPGNILIESGPQRCVKITDFGLARAADDASVTQSGVIAGTPMFMAPEQALGNPLDHRADLFSLGSVLYTMCSGRPPFRANNSMAVLKRVVEEDPRPIREIIPEVPEWLCEIINGLHAKNPDNRIATASEVADLLSRGLVDTEISFLASGPTRLERKPREFVASAETVEENPVAQNDMVEENVEAVEPVVPSPVDSRSRPRSSRWSIAAALVLLIAGLSFTEASGITEMRGTIIRLFSAGGTLVVEVDDAAVSVKIEGADLVITGAGVREIRLRPGEYTVEASRNGKLVTRELVTVTNNGRRVVRVSQESQPDANAKPQAVGKAVATPAPPVDEEAEWVATVSGLPPDERMKAVANRLKELNPGFDGRIDFAAEGNVVFQLKTHARDVANIAPLRVLKGLTSLECAFTNISDLTPLKGIKLKRLHAMRTSVKDLSPLEGMPLTSLDLFHCTGVTDLAPLRGMPLEYLNLTQLPVTDLEPLSGMVTLQSLVLEGTPISDLTPLRGLPLRELKLKGTNVSNLDAIKDFPLTLLSVDYRPEYRDLLRSFTRLTQINDLPVDQFWKKADSGPDGFDEWRRQTIALPVEGQLAAVTARLLRSNPESKGLLSHRTVDGVVTEIEVGPGVSDISALSALVGVKSVRCNQLAGGRLLADLTPLKGLKLTSLAVMFTPLTDLSPLRDISTLKSLDLTGTHISDLSPIENLPLTDLNVSNTNITDLSSVAKITTLRSLALFQTSVTTLTPLEGMKLDSLDIGRTGVSDLSPLKQIRLSVLSFRDMPISDLSPLKDLPLTSLNCHNTSVSDLTPVAAAPLVELDCSGTKVTDLSLLKGRMTLKRLSFHMTGIRDLTPLRGLQLEEIRLPEPGVADAGEILREMKSLKLIGVGQDLQKRWSADEFWTRFDRGEFK